MLFRCSRCLYPNTKPDLYFIDGVCSACLAFDRRKSIDWDQRKTDFLELVNAHRGSSHDVIVACSGGKDSTWQIIKCLELGLRPLAVTATTDHLSALGRRNLDNVSNLCDHVEVTPHRPTRRKIARFALQEVGDVSWCEHQLIWSVPARESVARNIPVVLYGEAPQNEYGAGPPGSEKLEQLTKDWVDEFGGLLGLRLIEMGDHLGIEPRNLEVYRYPENAHSVRALFMGAFFPWDGRHNAEIAGRHGFQCSTVEVEGSYGGHENIDNGQTGAHDWLRWLKFGYSRATDILSNDIRRGRISRQDAAALALERDGRYPHSYLGIPLDEILANIDMSREQFNAICDRYTNKATVNWALRPESYLAFCGTNTDASKDKDLAKTAA